MKFLDLSGLARFKAKIDALLSDEIGKAKTHYATCATVASEPIKEVSSSGFVLQTGAKIIVYFRYSNAAPDPMLSVNGSQGAYIYYNETTIPAKYLEAGKSYLFVYDGVHFALTGDVGKIDVPEGTAAGRFLQTDENGEAVWGNPASATTIANNVEEWLEENISGGETIAVDSSLTVKGAAADAKTAGDAINDIIDELETQYGYDVDFDETAQKLYILNKSGTRTGNGATIHTGIGDLSMGTETVDGTYYLVLFDEDGTEVCRTEIAGGGSGGGSSATANMTLTNVSGWTAKTISKGSDLEIELEWSSIEDELPTGNGTMTVTVNGIRKTMTDVAQGNLTIPVGSYLETGSNTVVITITDSYGNSRKRNFSISAVELTISSSFDESVIQSGNLVYSYTPVGSASKTVYFVLDGVTIGTVVTSITGRQQSYTIPQQSHGAHTLRVYMEATIDNSTVRSNELYYEILWATEGETGVIVASSYNTSSVSQYSTVNIPYMVYTPQTQMSDVTISVNGAVKSEVSVDRTKQQFSYRVSGTGTQTVVIQSGSASKTITFTSIESDVECEAETENLALYLSSQSRSNNEANPATWTYGTGEDQIAATFTGFNWTSDGWQTDDDGVVALRVSGDDRVTIPYKPFANDFRATGKTIEIEFATRDVLDYDAVILSCMDQGRGINLTAQSCSLSSEQSSISMQFKEDEHVRVGFVVEKRSGYRRMYCYINGTMCGVIQYPDDDDFSQITPQNITIGNNYCTTDVYCIRVYDNDLSSQQMEENWIADTQDGALLTQRFNHNNVRDEYGNVVISKLPSDLPYMIIECPELPQYKGDKKVCSGQYVDPLNTSKSFTFADAQIDVQGTSSQYYERKNYKIKFKKGFTMTATGTTVSEYQMRDSSIPTSSFCMKADVASSEGANNVELAILYNNACPYKTPAQEEDSRVRQGIDGFPIVIFWTDTENETTTFLGKYNFNNDKGTEEVFGFKSGDESWEVKNNTGNRVLWKSADYSGTDWLNDFEARYPDTDPAYTDSQQLAEFASWMVSVDPEQATGNTLSSPVTITDGETTTTYTNDTAAYRKAKFRAELEDYVELDSALFYYLFTELFLMVDSRAKNMFPSFIGENIT